jgi:hypothetical protein
MAIDLVINQMICALGAAAQPWMRYYAITVVQEELPEEVKTLTNCVPKALKPHKMTCTGASLGMFRAPLPRYEAMKPSHYPGQKENGERDNEDDGNPPKRLMENLFF